MLICVVMDIEVYLGAKNVPRGYRDDGPLYFHRRSLNKDSTPRIPWCYFTKGAGSTEIKDENKIKTETYLPFSKPTILEGTTSITYTCRSLGDCIDADIQ